MPARLAAIPRTPPEPAAGRGSARRVAERLARSVVVRTGTGSGFATPLNLILPKALGANGAWAADTATTTTPRATCEVALAVGTVAEAGSAREATMAPDMTITAEVLLAGLAEREIADEKDDAEPEGCSARWRPAVWVDTGRNLSSRLLGQLSVQSVLTR